jgi:hypothetical protein
MIIPATVRLSRLRWEWWLFPGHLKVRTIFLTSVSDPDPVRSVDPDPESGSGSRKAKMTQENIYKKFHVLKCCMFSFEG